MTRFRTGKAEGRGTPIEDVQVLQDAFQMLFESETEFSIKVEGTATLPYASRIQQLYVADGLFVLKLVRPLPHELMAGALFRMTFAVEDQRFEGILAFIGREGYLQYGFQLPPTLFQADRRLHRRFPFRPRENAYVIAQDSGIPGMGVAGPLVNISLGGMALRVDRVLRMDDGVRVPINTALFERGRAFPRFRLQDLPNLHLLEGRGVSAHVTEHGTELILGLSFRGLDPEAEAALAHSLDLREKISRSGQGPRTEGGAGPGRTGRGQGADGEAGAEALDDLEAAAPEAAPVPVTMLVRLQRRGTRVILVMADGPARQDILALLRGQGYHRLEILERLEQLRPLCQAGQRRALPGLVLADLSLALSGDAEPLAAVRVIENQLAELGEFRTAILCEEVDPTLLLAQETRTRFLPYRPGRGTPWIETLDGMLG